MTGRVGAFLLVLLAWAATHVRAEPASGDDGAAQAALRTLFGGEVPVAKTAPMEKQSTHLHGSVSQRAIISVGAGQTLALVIRQHFHNSPFNEKFLQRAFVELSPEAFIDGNPSALRKGAALRVPSASDLARLALPGTVTDSSGPVKPATETCNSGSDRRNWVRYP